MPSGTPSETSAGKENLIAPQDDVNNIVCSVAAEPVGEEGELGGLANPDSTTTLTETFAAVTLAAGSENQASDMPSVQQSSGQESGFGGVEMGDEEDEEVVLVPIEALSTLGYPGMHPGM